MKLNAWAIVGEGYKIPICTIEKVKGQITFSVWAVFTTKKEATRVLKVSPVSRKAKVKKIKIEL